MSVRSLAVWEQIYLFIYFEMGGWVGVFVESLISQTIT